MACPIPLLNMPMLLHWVDRPEHFLVRVGDHFPGLVERIMLLVCLDDSRLSGGAPLSQNILSAENQKLTDTGGRFPHGEGKHVRERNENN